jgi:hypothetical protein
VAADGGAARTDRLILTQKQIASATGATDRSVGNWSATGAISPTHERIRELSDISLLLSETTTPRREPARRPRRSASRTVRRCDRLTQD